MALGVLWILFIALAVIAIILQFLLYKKDGTRQNTIFIGNAILGFILSYMAYTSLPMNVTGQRNVAIGLAVVIVVALLLKFVINRYENASKLMLSVAIVGSFIQLFL